MTLLTPHFCLFLLKWPCLGEKDSRVLKDIRRSVQGSLLTFLKRFEDHEKHLNERILAIRLQSCEDMSIQVAQKISEQIL